MEMGSNFRLGRRVVGVGHPALIVAEIGQAHDGSYSQAHAMIDTAHQAGANAVKFQCHIAHAESYEGEPWRVKPRWAQDPTRYSYWERMEFTFDQWAELSEHARTIGLAFIVSPFSLTAVDMLSEPTLVDAWKLASGEIVKVKPNPMDMGPGPTNPMIRPMVKSRLPILISTGMSTTDEILNTVLNMEFKEGGEFAPGDSGLYTKTEERTYHADFALLHCASEYPTAAPRTALNLFRDLQRSVSVPVGISDHSGKIWPSIAAATLGASIIEVHVTWSRSTGLPDATSSLTFEEFARMVEGVRFVEAAHTYIDRDERARGMSELRKLFGGRWLKAAPRD